MVAIYKAVAYGLRRMQVFAASTWGWHSFRQASGLMSSALIAESTIDAHHVNKIRHASAGTACPLSLTPAATASTRHVAEF
jgi:hypothetical protein